jgi:hypothetical protein
LRPPVGAPFQMPDTPDPIAVAGQVGASLENQASILGQFFRKLCSEGFERAEAESLVRDYFEHVLEQGEGDDE